MSVLAARMRKVNADVSLEGTLIRRKAGVPIDAKQRAAAGSRIGDKERTDFVQARRKVANER